MKTFFRLTSIVRSYFWWMALAALIGFAATGSSVGLLMTSAYLIAKAALQPSISVLQIGIVGVRFFGIARGVLRYVERMVSHNTTFKILTGLRLWFYDAIEPLAPARLMRYKSSDLLERISDDIHSLENFYVRVLAPPVVALLVIVLMSALLGQFSVEVAGWMLIFYLTAGIGIPLLSEYLSRGVASGIKKCQTEQQILTIDLAQGIGELQVYGGLSSHLEKLRQVEKEKLGLQRKSALIEGLHEALIGLLMNAAVAQILWLAATSLVPSREVTEISLSVIVLGIMASFEVFLPLPAAVRHLDADIHAGNRLFEIIDTKPEVVSPQSPIPFPKSPVIHAENLAFRYPDAPANALENVTFTISPGQQVAFVGPSGAGKSTLASLLVRFWNPTGGTIKLNEDDIEMFDPEELRHSIALVSQRTYLFASTIRENLLLAAPEATDDMLKQALAAAGLGQFTEKLDEWVGQHGMMLSGGERQRMAIARALLQNAPVVIFDEATANLDTLTEQEMRHALEKLTAGKTVITITHRLQAMGKYDRIYVLDKGKLVEQGTHRDLIKQSSMYKRMWDLQHEHLPKEFLKK
ncbi:MAG: thiol reductant ABC exporter subunit CydC, partial [Desulfobulbaceae bacterium]|nr:thiol reductant ABC exporter subunit CydC [Desulfobulbaceae bacterium]